MQLALLSVGSIICILFIVIWRHTDHARIPDLYKLREDAQIIGVTYGTTGGKAGIAQIRTTVTFDDGFSYYTYDTNRDPHFGGETIYVTEHMVETFRKHAIEAHEKALKKKDERVYLDGLPSKEVFAYRWRVFAGKVSAHFLSNRIAYISIGATTIVLAVIIIITIASV